MNPLILFRRLRQKVILWQMKTAIISGASSEADENLQLLRKTANIPDTSEDRSFDSEVEERKIVEPSSDEASKTLLLNSKDEFTPMEEYLNQKRKVESLGSLEVALKVAKLSQMKVKEELPAQMKPLITWDELQAASTSVQPKTFGKRGKNIFGFMCCI